MEINNGMFAFVLVVGGIMAIAMVLIAMPFGDATGDDDGAYLRYTVDDIEIKDGKTVVTMTVENHGYSDMTFNSSNFVYQTEQTKAGEKVRIISNGAVTPVIKECPNGESRTIILTFDTVDEGVIKPLFPNHHIVN